MEPRNCDNVPEVTPLQMENQPERRVNTTVTKKHLAFTTGAAATIILIWTSCLFVYIENTNQIEMKIDRELLPADLQRNMSERDICPFQYALECDRFRISVCGENPDVFVDIRDIYNRASIQMSILEWASLMKQMPTVNWIIDHGVEPWWAEEANKNKGSTSPTL